MLEKSDLAPVDCALLDLLTEGRITAPYAAQEADYSTQYVRDRLARLVEHGNARKVYDGLYELVDDPRETENMMEAPPEPDEDPLREQLRDELAGSGDLLEKRVDAILSMYDVLRERGEAEKDDLLGAVDVDDTGYASAGSVWSNMVKGKDTLRELPGVEPPATGRTTWRYQE